MSRLAYGAYANMILGVVETISPNLFTPTFYAKSYEPIEELERDDWIILE